MSQTALDTTPEEVREHTQSWEDEEIQDYGDYMTSAAQHHAANGNATIAAHCALLAQTCLDILQEREAARQTVE